MKFIAKSDMENFTNDSAVREKLLRIDSFLKTLPEDSFKNLNLLSKQYPDHDDPFKRYSVLNLV